MSPTASSRMPRAAAIAAARRSIRSRSTDKRRDGRPGRRAQLELAAGFEGRGCRPDETGVESGRQHRRVDRAGPRGVGHRDQLDLGPDAPRPPRRGEHAAPRPRSRPCRQARPRLPPRHQCWYGTGVLNLYRILAGGDTTGVATGRDPLVGRRRGTGVPAGSARRRACGLRSCRPRLRRGRDRQDPPGRRAGRRRGRHADRLGRGVDDAGMPPLWPWIRAVRDLPGPRAALASVAAGAAQREYGSAEDTVAATFTADTRVVDALAEQSRSGPGLLLVLDDLQWADGATLRLLERVAPEARRLPVLVVGMHRDPAGGSLPGAIVHRARSAEPAAAYTERGCRDAVRRGRGGRPRRRAPGGRTLRRQPAVPVNT